MDGERIVVVSGLQPGEFLKNLSGHGVKSFNLRVLSPLQLAERAFACSGNVVEQRRIDRTEEKALIAQAMRADVYWEKVADSYMDLMAIHGAIYRMRSLIADADEKEALRKILLCNEWGEESAFRKKNEALYRVYCEYMRLLAAQNAIDGIGLIRKATKIEPGDRRMQILTLKEFPVDPVTAALIGHLSGTNESEISIDDLFPEASATFHIDGYANCYGIAAEVDHIIEDIYQRNRRVSEGTENEDPETAVPEKHADGCVVAVTDPAVYGQMFFDRMVAYDLPIAFGCGIPITNAAPAELLGLYVRWKSVGFYGKKALNAMLDSPAFCGERFWEDVYGETKDSEEKMQREKKQNEETNAGNTCTKNDTPDITIDELRSVLEPLRLTEDPGVNAQRLQGIGGVAEKQKYLPLLRRVAELLELPVGTFMERYAALRESDGSNAGGCIEKLDQAALLHIRNQTQAVLAAGDTLNEDTIQQILKERVCKQQSAEGRIYVTDIASAFGCIRQDLYIAGLTAAMYPGRPRENSLLLDHDLERFGTAAEIYTSQGKIRAKHEQLLVLVQLASKLQSRIYVSWPGWNAEELKENNASSLVYELYREEHPQAALEELERATKKVEYFGSAVSLAFEVGDAYNKKIVIEKEEPDDQEMLRRLQMLKERWEAEHRMDVADAEQTDFGWLSGERVWDVTDLELYSRCKRRFLYERLLLLNGEEAEDSFEVISAMERGRLAHRLIRRMDCRVQTLEDFLIVCEAAFEEHLKTHPALTEDVEEEKDAFLRMMRTAYQYEENDSRNSRITAAEPVEIKDEDRKLRLKAMPDRLQTMQDGRVMVLDYLTGLSTEFDTGREQLLMTYLLDASNRQEREYFGFERRYIALENLRRGDYQKNKKTAIKILDEFSDTLTKESFTQRRLNDEEEDTTDGTDSYCAACPYCVICKRNRIM